MLPLPNVTLVAIDTIAHALTAAAIRDSTKCIKFAETLIFSDRIITQGRHIAVDINSNEEAERAIWFEIPKHCHTSHFLLIQWDSWVINPDSWNPVWLEYDYIGAPWWWHRNFNVGNGGFSLRSVRLAKHVVNEGYRFETPEDDTLCRMHRPTLEAEGFKWAPEDVASAFSYERNPPAKGAFGFHGIFNWPYVLTAQQIAERLAIAPDYVLKSKHCDEMKELLLKRLVLDKIKQEVL